jgi:AraC-like DNA-binding protein
MSIEYQNVELGQVTLSQALTQGASDNFAEKIKILGFELLEPGKSSIISQIKSVIIDQVHYSIEPMTVNFSTLIAEKLHHEYAYLSRLFSSVEGITIEKFIAMQRIEKVKELLFYNEMTLSEISNKLNYSSVAHLSAQFKKETGMTPTQFKTQAKPYRKSLDNLNSKN